MPKTKHLSMVVSLSHVRLIGVGFVSVMGTMNLVWRNRDYDYIVVNCDTYHTQVAVVSIDNGEKQYIPIKGIKEFQVKLWDYSMR